MRIETTNMLRNHGQVKTMEIPTSWQPLEQVDRGTASPSWLSFGPHTLKDVELCLYYRGRPLSGNAQDNLKNLLELPPCQLTTKQLESISEVLRDASLADAFNFLNARTQDWNGRRVIIVEGRWNQMIADRFWMFVPTGPECEAVQEIWFQAPVDQYPAQLKQARQAIGSIKWID